jgi:hypothetical protein
MTKNRLSLSSLHLGKTIKLSWVVSLAFFWFSMPPAQGAWDLKYTLPINAANYPRAPTGASKFSINTAYEVAQPVQLGQTMRIKVLIPPGASSAKISAQSNSWQCAPDVTDAGGNIIVSQSERCPIMDGFDHDPGDLCPHNPTNVNSSPCGGGSKIYPQDLHTVTARLLDILYPTESNSPSIVTQARYAYFVLYQQPQALDKFAFTSNLGISFGISNVGVYNQWVDSGRSDVGGPIIVPNPTPTEPTPTEPTPTEPPAILGKSITINPIPINGTVTATTEPDGINCGDEGTDCNAVYTTGSTVTLTAIPKEGFALTRWEKSCSSGGASSPYVMTMDVDKTCSALFNKLTTTTFPEIEVFDGTTSIGDGATTPIKIGTHVGQPITKTFTVKNTGKSLLTLTEITPPSGFSLVGNLPGSIQANGSANFTVQLDATTEGSYSDTLEIANNDTDENPFNFVISGRVISEQDLNDGSLNGNWPFGNPEEFAGDAQIMVTVKVGDSPDSAEPLTRNDERVIEQGSFVDINATITPEPYHHMLELVVVAALDGEEEMTWDKLSNWGWYQKISDAEWKTWPLNLSKLYIEPYGTIRSGEKSYSINVFTGELTLGSVKRLHLFVGYGLWVSNGGYSYLVSQPVTLEMSEAQVVPGDQIHRRVPQ